MSIYAIENIVKRVLKIVMEKIGWKTIMAFALFVKEYVHAPDVYAIKK